MSKPSFTSSEISFPYNNFNGGLNSSAGPLSLQDNEASNLQNIDFNLFGSIVKRNGYTALNTTAITSSPDIDGLFWYEFNSSGTLTRHAVMTAGAKFYKMDDLDGTWDDITGGITITAGNHCDFENFLDEVYVTNNQDPPWKWTGTGNVSAMTVPAGLTDAKWVVQFNNYLFLGNVAVSGTRHNSRIYWSNLKDTGTWTATDFIDVAKNDGQEITGMKVLGDRLVIYKNRSIYNLFFTGDADIPFILPGGGKSNSSVGCANGFTVQETNNGHIFMSYDGFYFYDGNNSYKISDKINSTFLGLNTTRLDLARSLIQRNKNRYWCALPAASETENNRVLVYDWYNNAWSIYTDMAPSAMATFYVSGYDERPYWGDYSGFVYRGDTGTDDYPLNVQTAINAIFYTNWRSFNDLVDKKGVPHIVLYFQNANTTLDFGYSYDFEGVGGGLAEDDSDQYTQTIDLSTSSDAYGSAAWDSATYAGTGGDVVRRDLIGRGRVIRFKFANNVLSETFQIDGVGIQAYLETHV